MQGKFRQVMRGQSCAVNHMQQNLTHTNFITHAQSEQPMGALSNTGRVLGTNRPSTSTRLVSFCAHSDHIVMEEQWYIQLLFKPVLKGDMWPCKSCDFSIMEKGAAQPVP